MLTKYDLHNASFELTDSPGCKEIVFNDPFTRTRLDPSQIPPSIVASPHLLRGLNRLANYGRREHHITIAGANHNELTQFYLKNTQDLLNDHDVVFLEGIGHNASDRRHIQEVAQGKVDLPESFAERWGQYKVLQMAALVHSRKATYYADIPGDGTEYESALIKWGELANDFTSEAHIRTGRLQQNLYRAALINISANTILREWHILGTMGNSLSDAEQKGFDIDSSILLIGTEHTHTLPKKLGMLGVTTSTTELTIYHKGSDNIIENSDFDFTTAVRDYRAPIIRQI